MDYEKVVSYLKSKIKKIIKSFTMRDFMTFLFFLLVSFSLWIIIASQKKYESNIVLPIKYVNIPDDCVFADSMPQRLIVSIEDYGSSLLSYKLFYKFKPLEIDVSQYMESKSIQTISLKPLIFKRINSGIQVNYIRPENINFKFHKLKEKVVPILYDGMYQAEMQYFLVDSVKFNPIKVSAFIPEQIYDSINCVYLEPINYYNIKDTFRTKIPLKKIDNVKFSVDYVDAEFVAHKYTEKSLTMPIQILNKPHEISLKLFPSTIKTDFFVDVMSYEDVVVSSFDVYVDFNDIDFDKNKLELKLKNLPKGVFHVRFENDSIEYLIEENAK